MNATIGYFIGFALGCIAMFIAIKLDFSSIAKMILIFSLLIGSVIMKVRASVKKICEKCKIIKRRRVLRVICENARHKQRQG